MLAALCQWLIGWGKYVGVMVINLLVDILQAAINAFVDFSQWVLSMWPSGPSLPTAPTAPGSSVYLMTVQTLNWVFPLSYCVQLVEFMVAAILAYVVIAPIARWVKILR